MFFLLRMAFWLTLVLALLPSGGSQPSSGPQIGAGDAVVAATAAVSDMSHFCERQAEACAVGTQAAVVIGQRAQAGARMVFDFISDQMARNETGALDDPKVVSAVSRRTVPSHPGSQSTLTPDDLAPVWQGPKPRRDAKPRA
jgi:hypothetical protein